MDYSWTGTVQQEALLQPGCLSRSTRCTVICEQNCIGCMHTIAQVAELPEANSAGDRTCVHTCKQLVRTCGAASQQCPVRSIIPAGIVRVDMLIHMLGMIQQPMLAGPSLSDLQRLFFDSSQSLAAWIQSLNCRSASTSCLSLTCMVRLQ